jgi:ADP-heptose:LPS heptosyltransferase
MSLPLAFKTDAESIPAAVPYLAPPPAAAAKWAQRLPQSGRLRVGLAWSGNPTHRNDRHRSIPLDRLAPLLDVPGVDFVSLQRDLREDDRRILQSLPRIASLGDTLADFADTAAILARLDLLIAVDTAVAHLAGSLAKPVWVMLPFLPDWRWMLARNDCPWYPTARLYRQPALGDWDSVLAQMRRDLAVLAGAAGAAT